MKYLFLLLSMISVNLAAQQVVWDSPGTPTRKTVAEPSPAYRSAYNDTQLGYATYYADYLAGKPTAYGETYQPGQLTASHALLPMGTILEVKRLDNGNSVKVRVNDNTGHSDGSLVVVSRQAAHELGMLPSGRTRVSVKRVGFDNWNPKPGTVRKTVVPTAAPATYSQVNRPQQPVARTVTPSRPYYRPASYGNSNAPDFGSATVKPDNAYQDPYAHRQARSVEPQRTASTPPVYTGYKTAPVVTNRAVVPSRSAANAEPATYSRPVQATAVAPVQEVHVVRNNVQQGYGIQLAAYGNIANAQRQVRSLQNRGVDNVYITSVNKADGTMINRVMVGPFANAAMAQQSADDLLKARQISGIVTRLQ